MDLDENSPLVDVLWSLSGLHYLNAMLAFTFMVVCVARAAYLRWRRP